MPPRAALIIRARSLISFCVIFAKLVMCFFGHIQNSYGCDGAQGQNAANSDVLRTSRAPALSGSSMSQTGHTPLSLAMRRCARTSSPMVGGSVEKETISACGYGSDDPASALWSAYTATYETPFCVYIHLTQSCTAISMLDHWSMPTDDMVSPGEGTVATVRWCPYAGSL